ncbi:hypothetical protein SPFL3102_03575 [Sporomusaceae bacterium FL31]|nr:hypothetical protein SPFL3101_00430 [Sporomusaceae bacterium FL31]GCE35724.1 hypothetical protein SPFL3102_03575 [Sporomusaceae bacterium]
MPTVQTAARDLVPSTEAKAPESPIMGGIGDLRLGKEALKIKLDKPQDSTIKF